MDLTGEMGLSEDKLKLLAYLLDEEAIAPLQTSVIPPRSRAGAAPLSFAQQRLWLLDQLQPNTALYTIAGGVWLRGALDVHVLRRSLGALVQRHETLRTTFAMIDGQPAQQIGEASGCGLPMIDLRGLPALQRPIVARRLAAEEARRPFDLARGPLLRTTLLRLEANEHILLFAMHHIISDGWSLDIFIGELMSLYAALAAGRPSPLPRLAIQYADFATWQRETFAKDGTLEADLAYWRGQLGDTGNHTGPQRADGHADPQRAGGHTGPPLLDLPTDRPRPAAQTFAGATRGFTLSSELARLLALSQQAGATLFMTLLAAFQVLLARYSGQRDIVVGSPIANRTQPGIEGLIGFFVNLLVLRTDLSGDPPFRDLLERVRAACLGAYAHQELPFEQLVEALQPQRELNRHPLFTVAFALQHAPPAHTLPGLSIEPLDIDNGLAKYDLTCTLTEGPAGLCGWFEYSADLFDTPTIDRMARHFRALLEGIAAHPERRISELPLLTGGERQQLVLEWNDTAREVRSQKSGVRSCRGEACLAPTWLLNTHNCIHELVDTQVERAPDAVAVAFDAGTTNDQRPTTNDPIRSSFFVIRHSSNLHLTYRELNARANQLAHYLRGLGVGPSQRVGVSMERSISLIVALLGVVKAGAAYVPLDPDYPPERRAFVLADSQARVLLTNDRVRDRGSGVSGQDSDIPSPDPGSPTPDTWTVVDLHGDWPAISRMSAANPASSATAADQVYVIYTSGSTGQPKGVVVPHQAVTRLVLNTNYVALSAADRVAQASTAGFDAATFEIWGALANGAQLIGIARQVALSPHEFAAQLRAQAISVLFTTTALFNQLARTVPSAFRGLSDLLFGGEAVAPEWVRAVLRGGPARRLLHVYGPTESTTFATWHLVRDLPAGATTIPIGRAIANTQVYVLDRAMRPVPVGIPGELYIGGDGLAWGYLNRPELTAERFVPNPFAEVSGIGYRVLGAEPSDTQYPAPDTRLYKTGDLVRYQPDGSIVFVGRIDQQVKIRGFRIEPEEIEAVLGKHPAVRERIVVVREDTPGERRLVAYVVPTEGIGDRGQGTVPTSRQPAVGSIQSNKTGSEPSSIVHRPSSSNEESEPSSFVLRPSSFVSELRSFLKERLPDYMLPSAFVLLDGLPLTPNGKVDRRALPEPLPVRPELERSFVASRTPDEELIAGIWADVLSLDHVGIDDNFFELGGHSLLATQVMGRIRDAFHTDLALRHLFETGTVRGLAGALAATRQTGPEPAPPITRAARIGALPLSFAQQRLWFLDQLAPQSALYNVPIAVRLSGTLDLVALARSLQALVSRHETLRTTFASADGQPRQVIAPAQPLRRRPGIHEGMPSNAKNDPFLIDLRALPEQEREIATVRLAATGARRPFDLARGPLLRTTLLRLAQTDHALLLTMHHIIADGWSLGVFIRELAALYASFSNRADGHNGAPALPPLPIQYADFAIWQRGWLQGEVLQSQFAYWKAQLSGAPALLNLPTDWPRPAVPSFEGRRRAFRLPSALAEGLAALSRRADATLFMTLLAAFQALLARYSGQRDILVGAPIAGRTRAELEELIGFFVNTLVLRGDLSGDPSFHTLLSRTRAACLGAYAHQDLPFEQLVEELQPAREPGHTPLFQVVLALQNAPLPAMRLPDLMLEPLEIDNEIVKFDLTLTIIPTDHGLAGSLGYPIGLFDAATITRMLGHFRMLLAAIVMDPARRLSDLPLLTESERRQLLIEWNDTVSGVRSQGSGVRSTTTDHSCLHELFEAQAARAPDAVALVFDAEMTKSDAQRAPGRTKDNHEGAFVVRHSSFVVQMTYAELNRRANQLAHYLRDRGVRPESRVGICVERSPELVIGLLGILKAGAAYIPLDPSYPAERIAFMFEDSRAAVVITATNSVLFDKVTRRQGDKVSDVSFDVTLSPSHLVTGSQGMVVDLRADALRIAAEPDTDPGMNVAPEHLAYVIYTSGSTGWPKGVMIPHRGIVNRLRWGQDAYRLSSGDRVLQKAPFSFDASIWEIFWPLATGARLVLARPNRQRDSAYLVDVIARQQITIVHFVPSMLQIFLEEPALERCRGLRRVFCGGEPLPTELKDRCMARLAASLHNQYGPTETSVNATFWSCAPGSAEGGVPIGRPIANIQAYILDARLRPAPIGVPGELHLGGAGLARGYQGRPDLTAERFIPNPFARVSGIGSQVSEGSVPNTQHPTPNTRLYRTGDLARYRPDGAIMFLGRIDEQVKLRGFRVELGEIAEALAQHPAVRECVVVVREDAPGAQRLAAYVVPTNDQRPTTKDERLKIEDRRLKIEDSDAGASAPSSSILYPLPSELRAFLAEKLPDYMIPAAFVLLDALPLSPNGKVDRRALPALDHARPGMGTPFVAPRTAVEEQIARIWADVLGVEQIGVDDSFFDLGGHSLLATRVVSRIREALHAELPLRMLFERPTIAGLAQALAQREEQAGSRPIRRIERVEEPEEELLAKLDHLSDAEVEALLGTLSDEEGALP